MFPPPTCPWAGLFLFLLLFISALLQRKKEIFIIIIIIIYVFQLFIGVYLKIYPAQNWLQTTCYQPVSSGSSE